MAVIRNLPANNSDVNVNVVAMNVFGSGRNGTASDTISKLHMYIHTLQVLLTYYKYVCMDTCISNLTIVSRFAKKKH